MLSWLTAAVYCEETFGVQVDMTDGFFVCPECGEWVAPYEYNSSDGEAWFLNGRFFGEIKVKCPHCGYHNYVSFSIEKACVLEVK